MGCRVTGQHLAPSTQLSEEILLLFSGKCPFYIVYFGHKPNPIIWTMTNATDTEEVRVETAPATAKLLLKPEEAAPKRHRTSA